MQYRNIFMEFMYEYREYFADCIQLIVLENNKNNDLINYFSEFEEVHVFQSKDIQVFYKKRSFNDIQNTVLELALMDDVPQVHELNDINDLVDIYNGETLEKKPSRFVYIKPIINDTSLKAVLIVYSNFPTEGMVNDKKLIKLCDALQLSLSDDLYQIAKENRVNVVSVPMGTYKAANMVKLCNYVKLLNATPSPVTFRISDYRDTFIDVIDLTYLNRLVFY